MVKFNMISYTEYIKSQKFEVNQTLNSLTHWGRVTNICVVNLTTIGADQATSHYLNQCWNIVNLNLRNKFQWNLNRYSYIFIQENGFENVVWKMSAILSLPQCVKNTTHLGKMMSNVQIILSVNWPKAADFFLTINIMFIQMTMVLLDHCPWAQYILCNDRYVLLFITLVMLLITACRSLHYHIIL